MLYPFARVLFFLWLPLAGFATDHRFEPYVGMQDGNKEFWRPYREAVHFLSTDNGECSATMISNDGILLTARHCVHKCFMKTKVFARRQEQDVDYFVQDESKLGEGSCKAELDGEEVEIIPVATPPGFITKFDERSFASLSRKLFYELVAENYTDGGDFAMVRVKGRAKTACVPLATTPVAAGDKVFSLGFPALTSRPDGVNSDGVQAQFTSGEVLTGIEENPCWQELKGDARAAALSTEYNRPDSFLSTMDGVYGSSGSSVLNESGEVVGVFNMTYVHPSKDPSDKPENRHCRGSIKSLRTEHFRKMLGKLNPVCKR